MKKIIISDAHLTAAIASTTIIIASLIYWTIQIQAVREMLALAYD